MTTMYILMNHEISEDQKADATKSLGVTTFRPAPDIIRVLWADIPPNTSIQQLRQHLHPIQLWLQTDCLMTDAVYLMVHGETGATYSIVSWVQEHRPTVKVVHATSKRETVEEKQPDGSVKKTTLFRHIRFREYY